MRRAALFVLFFCVFAVSPMAGAGPPDGESAAPVPPEVTVIMSLDVRPYREAVEGFLDACRMGARQYLLTGGGGAELPGVVKTHQPALVLAVGEGALRRALRLEGVPVVFVMVSDPQRVLEETGAGQQVSGVSMNVPASRQLGALLGAEPSVRKIGVVFDPGRTIHLYNEAHEAARKLGLELVGVETGSPLEVPGAVGYLLERVDALWMLPDITVWSGDNIHHMLGLARARRVPVIGISKAHAQQGARVGFALNAGAMGVQACGLARETLGGVSGGEARVLPPQGELQVAR